MKSDFYQLPPEEALPIIVRYLLQVAAASDPQSFKGFLMGGVLTNCVAALPEDYFDRMTKIEPCGRVGCDCHLMANEARNFLQSCREDHQRYAGMLHKD